MEVDNPVLNSAVAALKSGKQPHFNAYVNSIVDYCIENEKTALLITALRMRTEKYSRTGTGRRLSN
jgi:hypothetical protein